MGNAGKTFKEEQKGCHLKVPGERADEMFDRRRGPPTESREEFREGEEPQEEKKQNGEEIGRGRWRT